GRTATPRPPSARYTASLSVSFPILARPIRRSAPAMHAPTSPIISVANLSKTYASGFQALKRINLDIRRGEILALLGPNGAGKTTLIQIVCGIVKPSDGAVSVAGHDSIRAYRGARSTIGLVPQELTSEAVG